MVVLGKPDKDPKPNDSKKPYDFTDARRLAAVRNAQASTGPGDCSRSRLNNWRHGFCSRLPILMENEDPEAVQQKIQRYIVESGAQTESEKDAIAFSVYEMVRCRRVEQADTDAEERHAAQVEQSYDNANALKATALIERFPSDPAGILIQLMELKQGVCYILDQVDQLDLYLQSHTSLHPSQRTFAIMIMGRRPRELFTSPQVMDFNLGVISGINGATGLAAGDLADILGGDKPHDMPDSEYERRLGEQLDRLRSIPEAQEYLRTILRKYRDLLLGRLAELLDREERDLARAVSAAKVSVRDETMKRMRYRRDHVRGYFGALAHLRHMQLFRLKHGAALGAGPAGADTAEGTSTATAPTPETAPAAAPAEPSEGPAPPPSDCRRSKARDPQAVEGSTTCEGSTLQPELSGGSGAPPPREMEAGMTAEGLPLPRAGPSPG
jgi:hypothetical protein